MKELKNLSAVVVIFLLISLINSVWNYYIGGWMTNAPFIWVISWNVYNWVNETK